MNYINTYSFPKLTYRYKTFNINDFNRPANVTKLFTNFIDKKFNVKSYNVNSYRKQMESYNVFIAAKDTKTAIIHSFNHSEGVSSIFYNLMNKFMQSNEYQNGSARLLGNNAYTINLDEPIDENVTDFYDNLKSNEIKNTIVFVL